MSDFAQMPDGVSVHAVLYVINEILSEIEPTSALVFVILIN